MLAAVACGLTYESVCISAIPIDVGLELFYAHHLTGSP